MTGFLKWFGIGLALVVIIVFVLLAINVLLPPGWKMGSEVLIFLTGVILSLFFTYLPDLRTAFAALTSAQKSFVNLALVTLLAVFMFIGTCTNFLPIPGVECSQAGLKTLALYIFLAAGGNQLAYNYSPQPMDVKLSKYERAEG